MKKKLLASLIVLGGFVSVATFAYQGNPGVKNPNPTDMVRHEDMTKALATKDYNAWKSLMQNNGVINKITTESQFKKFVEMKEFYDKGDTVNAEKIRQELGLGQKDGSGAGKGYGKGQKNGMAKGMRLSK